MRCSNPFRVYINTYLMISLFSELSSRFSYDMQVFFAANHGFAHDTYYYPNASVCLGGLQWMDEMLSCLWEEDAGYD